MSDDFDDEEAQHRLIIDDPESADNNNQNAGKSAELQGSDSSEKANSHTLKDSNGRESNSPEAMDTTSPDQDKVGNGHSSETSSSRSSKNFGDGDNTSKHALDLDNESGYKSLTEKSSTKSFLAPAAKKKKMSDKSTCVHTKSCQVDEGLNLLSLKNGSTTCINITIVCKSGGNTLFIMAKWKGREYHGVLTDGEHSSEQQHSTNTHKKHPALDKNADHGNADSSNHTGGGKARGKRGARAVEKKNRHECNESDDNGDNFGKNDDAAGSKLVEVSDKAYSRCPHRQCGFRFSSINDLNSHMLFSHVEEKAILTETIATQTSAAYVESGTDNCANDAEFIANCGGIKPQLCSKCKQSTSPASATPLTTRISSLSATQSAVASKDSRNVMIFEDQSGSVEDLFKAVRSPQSSNRNPVTTVVSELDTSNCVKNENSGAKDGNTPSAFSDISDDGAPTLEKEESFDKGSDQSHPKKAEESLSMLAPPMSGANINLLNANISRSGETAQQQLGGDRSGVGKDGLSHASSSNALSTSHPEDEVASNAPAVSAAPSSSPAPSVAALAAAAAANLTPAQQQQIMALMPPGTSLQQMAAILENNGNIPPNVSTAMYATPFQPNFQLNPSYFPMNMSTATSQQFAAAAGKAPSLVGFSPTAAFSANQSIAASFAAAAAANGLSPASGATSSTGNLAQQKSGNADHLNAQRHKIYELKSGSNTSSANASLLMASPVTGGGSKDSLDPAGNNGAGRVSGTAGGGPDAPSPLRPSSSSAVPSSNAQRNMFKRPPTNSPSSSTGTQFLGSLVGGIPANLASAGTLNPQQAALLFNQQQQQQQIQQLNQMRNLGLPITSFLSPEHIAAQYAAAVLNVPQMPGSVPPSFAQQQQPTTQSQQQFPHLPHKQ